eukprot:12417948-Karenia_brevis.AAC.1
MELFKGKGSSAVPQSFRDVLLSDSDSKAFFGELRDRARGGLFGATPEGQFGGGSNFGSTASAHALAKAFTCIGLHS